MAIQVPGIPDFQLWRDLLSVADRDLRDDLSNSHEVFRKVPLDVFGALLLAYDVPLALCGIAVAALNLVAMRVVARRQATVAAEVTGRLIDVRVEDDLSRVWMTGPAAYVFTAEW